MWLFTIKVTNGRNRKKIPSISFISPFSNNSIIPIHITTFFSFFFIFNPSKPTLSNLKLPILFSQKSLYDYSQIGNKKKNIFQYHLHLHSQIIPWFPSTLSFFSFILIPSNLWFFKKFLPTPQKNISISSSNRIPFHKNPIDETLKKSIKYRGIIYENNHNNSRMELKNRRKKKFRYYIYSFIFTFSFIILTPSRSILKFKISNFFSRKHSRKKKKRKKQINVSIIHDKGNHPPVPWTWIKREYRFNAIINSKSAEPAGD